MQLEKNVEELLSALESGITTLQDLSADDNHSSVSTAVMDSNASVWRWRAAYKIVMRRVDRAEVHGVARSVLYRWAARVVKQAREREAGCVSADWHLVRALVECLRKKESIQNLSVVSTTKRSEVLDLWYQLCECAQMHKAQAQELELAKQEIDTLAAIEARLEELQLQARWSDRLGSALGDMVQYLRSKADHSLQSTASKSVDMTSVSELKELWKEISELASVHFRTKYEAMTQTPKPALNMQDKTVSASVPTDRAVGFTEESACTGMNQQDCSKERQVTDSCYISEQTAYIIRLEEEAVKKGEQVAKIKADLESAYKQIAQLKLHNKELSAADAKLKREDSMNAQKKFFVLEMQLQELGAALKARDDELESIKEERDVLGDEIARLQSRMVKLQRDKIEKYVVVEEASTRNSIEISDLIELIHSEAPWATCGQPACTLTLQETEDDLERLKNIFSILISEIKQTSKQLQSFNTFTLEHGRFDLLASESAEMVLRLAEQGPSAGFVESDIREIYEFQESLEEASENVKRSFDQIQAEWQRVCARECSHLLKRRQRFLQVLVRRLDGSSAPRHKIKALKHLLSQFSAADRKNDVLVLNGEKHAKGLHHSPYRSYAAREHKHAPHASSTQQSFSFSDSHRRISSQQQLLSSPPRRRSPQRVLGTLEAKIKRPERELAAEHDIERMTHNWSPDTTRRKSPLLVSRPASAPAGHAAEDFSNRSLALPARGGVRLGAACMQRK